MPWWIGFKTAERFSVEAFRLPGRFTIRVSPRMPAASRLRHALSVMVMLKARMASGMPLVSRWITDRVASGVISRGENPVPPVVRARHTFRSSLQWRSSSAIWSYSSGMILV